MLSLAWVVGVELGFGLTGIVATRAALTLFEAASYSFVWSRGRWSGIEIGSS
jgi:hypothetical protein